MIALLTRLVEYTQINGAERVEVQRKILEMKEMMCEDHFHYLKEILNTFVHFCTIFRALKIVYLQDNNLINIALLYIFMVV